MMISKRIVRYCAEEVSRQRRGPIEVANMVDAWIAAMEIPNPLTITVIEGLGMMIEPGENADGFRQCNVSVGTRICPDSREVRGLMEKFCQRVGDMTPNEAYREFEEIHPFRDGNGRVGKIVFNARNGSLDLPEMPPNFWGIANP